MIKYFYLLLLICYSCGAFSATLPVFVNDTSNFKIRAIEFVKLKPQEYKTLTGKKLTLKELIILKITQKKIKKMIKRGESIDQKSFDKPYKEFKWHWGGFLLGFSLPGLGFVITLFIKDEQRRSRIYSALIGFTLILGIIGIIAFFKTISGG